MGKDLEIMDAIEQERQEILEYIEQLRKIHNDNKSAITVLDFLEDLIRNRGK